MKNALAARSHAVEWSGIRVMFALADEIPGVINLGIGQPDFDTPAFIREAAKEALDQGFTRYPPAKGFKDLREAIADKLKAENNIAADPATEIFVAVGAMQVIFNTILHLVEPGQEVIVIDPGYDYYSQIRLFGGVPVPVPAYEKNLFKVDPADIAAAVSPRTKLIILNSPSNPTGAMFDAEILAEIARIARDTTCMCSPTNPMSIFCLTAVKHVSIAAFDGMKARTVSAYTLSKSYAMTGWRVGYAVAPKALIDEMEKLMEHMVSGVAAVAQRAALAAITAPQDCVREMVAEYDRRRKIIHEGLNAIDGIIVHPAGIHFLCVSEHIRLRLELLGFCQVSCPGAPRWPSCRAVFSAKRGEGYVRVSFAASVASLQEALARIKKGAAALRG